MKVVALLKDIKDRGIQLWVAPDGSLGFKAPAGAMSPELASAIKAHKPEIAAVLRAGQKAGQADRSLRRPAGVAPELSSPQKRIYFIQKLMPSSVVYHIPGGIVLEGPLQCHCLERAIRFLIHRHEVLRTCFAEVEGEPVPVIAAEVAWHLTQVDLAELDLGENDPRVMALAQTFLTRPFDLAVAPLFRALLIRVQSRKWVLLWDQHHIITDDWSDQIFMRELATAYAAFSAGAEPPLPELSHRYSDFAWWQNRNAVRGGDIDWWTRTLAGAAALELPTDAPRPPLESFQGANLAISWDGDIARAVKRLANRTGTSPFMVYLTAFGLVFQRHSGQRDFVVGTTFGNRDQPEWEQVLGFFINSLPLRLSFDEGETLYELLARVGRLCLEAFAHGHVPFESMVEAARIPRDRSRHPLFQVLFTYTNAPKAKLELGPLAIEPLAWGDNQVARMDMTIALDDRDEGVSGVIEYNRDLFARETIAALIDQVTRVLAQMTVAEPAPPARFELLAEQERQALRRLSRGTEAAAEAEDIVSVFTQVADRHPHRIALHGRGEARTFRQVKTEAETIAAALQALGVGPDDRVALCLSRELRLPIAILGVLMSGAAYVPLDPAWPPLRLATVLEEARPALAIVTADTARTLDSLRVPRLDLDELGRVRAPRPSAVAAEQLAYVLYTSGSTGRPKGVAITRRALACLVAWGRHSTTAAERTGVFVGTAVTFDVSVCEILVNLANGGTLIMGADALDLARHPSREQVRMIYTAPSAMAALLAQGPLPENLLRVNLAGEALPPALLRELLEQTHLEEVCNLYGPTEDTVYATMARLADSEPVLGDPLPGKESWVLDRQLREVPFGVPGELLLAGWGLARGYLGRPALTASHYIPHPFAAAPGARLYRTGDLVRRDRRGRLHFLGRLDHQIKLNGYRIELEEINLHLCALAGVRQAIAQVRTIAGIQRLIAFVCLEGAETPERLRDGLRDRLPSYMVPELFIALPDLPLTAHGKIDRKALAAMALPEERPAGAGKRPPATPTQQQLAEIWAALLELEGETIGLDDHFFRIGGHSLLAGRVAARIAARMGVEVPIQLFFEAPTLEAMAAKLDAARAIGGTLARPMTRSGDRAELLPLSFSQLRLWLTEQMGDWGDAYHISLILRLDGYLEPRWLEQAIADLLERHEALRTVFLVVDDQPVQRVLPPERGALRIADHKPGEQPWLSVSSQPFDLEQGPLYRFALYRSGRDCHHLAICLHHLVADGWSLSLLFDELIAGYRAASGASGPPLPEVFPYPEYALWQSRTQTEEAMAAELAWWQDQLAGLPETIALPADHPRGDGLDHAGDALPFSLSKAQTAALEALASDRQTTLYVVLLSAFTLVLHHLSGQDDLAVGTPIAGRRNDQLAHTIGCFINTLVIRAKHPHQPYPDYLRQLRDHVLQALDHQDLPFEKLVEHLTEHRDTANTPLFQVMFSLMHAMSRRQEVEGLSVTVAAPPRRSAQYALTLALEMDEDGISGELEYDAGRFVAATAHYVLEQWQRVLTALVANPELFCDELFLVPTPLQAVAAEPCTATVLDLLAARARAYPAAPALIGEHATLAYADLLMAARSFAQRLTARGLRPYQVVGIHLEADASLVVAILAVHWVGAAYLNLDPKVPGKRLDYMVRDAGCRCLISHTLPSWLSDDLRCEPPPVPVANASAPVWDYRPMPADALAYVVYTSGTTGVPKGIAIPHRALSTMAVGVAERYGLKREDRAQQFASIGFDLFAEELFATLVSGAALVLRPERGFSTLAAFAAYTERQRVTVLNLPVSWWSEWLHALEEGDAPIPSMLRVLIVGSEAVPRDTLDQWRAKAPHIQFFNAYGPSETCVTVTIWHDLEGKARAAAHTAPIGTPIPAATARVCDRAGRSVIGGVPGELLIGGPTLARGYLGRPGLTAEKFVPDPAGYGARRYRSGDLVRQLPGAEALAFIGRQDSQIKIRGFRIEPREIEVVLRRRPEIENAHVLARTVEGSNRLVAYLVGQWLDRSALVGALAGLPDYMHPDHWVWLERLPTGATGKIDPQQLPLPQPELHPRSAATSAPDDFLAEVMAHWQQVAPATTPDDDFFDLGGNSLRAVRLLGALNRNFGTQLSLAHFMNATTPRRMASLLAERRTPAERALVTLHPGAGPRFYLIHAATGLLLPYRNLAQCLAEQGAVFGFQATHSEDDLAKLAARYLDEADWFQDAEEVTLVAWSLGGLIAWEMAARLAQRGRRPRLALLDTYPLWQLPAVDGGHELLAQMAVDLGLNVANPERLWELVPPDWDGSDRRVLDRLRAHLPEPLNLWPAPTLYNLWDNYRAHVRAAGQYRPAAPTFETVLFSAAQHGELDRAGALWRRAGYELEEHLLDGDHHGLLDPPLAEVIAQRIAQQRAWEPASS